MTSFSSPAKINWLLRILGPRGDGFHQIETVFQQISLADTLEIEPSESFRLSCDDPAVPSDETNLIWRAWQKASERFGCPPVSVHISKEIPMQGGLGGGSSNAATLLRAVNEVFSLDASSEELEAIALELGSDVPFFLRGGTAYATGRGEILTFLDHRPAGWLLLVVPELGVSTAQAYDDLKMETGQRIEPIGLRKAKQLMSEPILESGSMLINDFEPGVYRRHPLLSSIHSRLSATGASWVRMSGSGSTIVALYGEEKLRDRAHESMNSLYLSIPAHLSESTVAQR